MKDKIFNKKIVSIVIPIAIQTFMVSLVNASDAIMLGLIEQDALSAVSLAGQVFFVFYLFLASLMTGTNMFAAQYFGKGDIKSIEKILGYVLKLSFIISIIFFLGTTFIPQYLMRIFTSDQTLIDYGSEYLQTVSIMYVFSGFTQIYLCIMKNCGKTSKSTIITASTVVINIFLNAILILGLFGFPRLEIVGAAIATVISQLIGLVWTLIEGFKKDSVKIRLKYILKIDKELIKDFWKYTLPAFGNQLVWGIGFTMYSVIMGHLGKDAVAANSIANIVKNLIACLCVGLGSGSGIIIGNELGKGNLKKAKEYGGKLCKLSLINGLVSALLLLLLTPIILRFANITPQAKHYLKWMLIMCSYYLAGKSINSTTITGIFSAGGNSKFGFKCDAITMWAVTVPLGFIAAFLLDLPVIAVYFIITLDEIVKLPAVYKNYKKYVWVKNITRNFE